MFGQSTLPEAYREVTIMNDLDDGKTGYTMPWAMFADKKRRLWINGAYPFSVSPSGTSSLEIRRVGKIIQVRKDSLGDRTLGGGNFVGASKSDFLPVQLV